MVLRQAYLTSDSSCVTPKSAPQVICLLNFMGVFSSSKDSQLKGHVILTREGEEGQFTLDWDSNNDKSVVCMTNIDSACAATASLIWK